MKTLVSLALIFAVSTSLAFAAEGESTSGIPRELKGFKGMVTGTLIKKRGSNQFDLELTSIKKVWKANQAEHPEKAVGKSLTVSLEGLSDHHREKIMENFHSLNVGDAILVELFDVGLETLSVKEALSKAED